MQYVISEISTAIAHWESILMQHLTFIAYSSHHHHYLFLSTKSKVILIFKITKK